MLNKGAFRACFLLFLMGCSEQKQESSLHVTPIFNNQKLQCEQSFSADENTWQIGQIQFFISQLELQNQQGEWQKIALLTSAEQVHDVALLGVNCRSQQAGNWQIKFNSPIDLNAYKKARFSLGVPFELNHLNPLTQSSPLNVSSMFWVWQTGHKFARIELENQHDDWLFHLGSVGCQSPSVMRSPQNACRYPNLFSVEVELNDTKQIYFDLEALTANIQLSSTTSCQSEHDNPSCQQLFNHLQNVDAAVFRSVNNVINGSEQNKIEQAENE